MKTTLYEELLNVEGQRQDDQDINTPAKVLRHYGEDAAYGKNAASLLAKVKWSEPSSLLNSWDLIPTAIGLCYRAENDGFEICKMMGFTTQETKSFTAICRKIVESLNSSKPRNTLTKTIYDHIRQKGG